jgi:hypothetical protein
MGHGIQHVDRGRRLLVQIKKHIAEWRPLNRRKPGFELWQNRGSIKKKLEVNKEGMSIQLNVEDNLNLVRSMNSQPSFGASSMLQVKTSI